MSARRNQPSHCRHHLRCQHGILRTCQKIPCRLWTSQRTYLCNRFTHGRSTSQQPYRNRSQRCPPTSWFRERQIYTPFSAPRRKHRHRKELYVPFQCHQPNGREIRHAHTLQLPSPFTQSFASLGLHT